MKEDLESYKNTIKYLTENLVKNHNIKGIDIMVDIERVYDHFKTEEVDCISVDLNIKY